MQVIQNLLSGYLVTEYRPWLATRISQCCERLLPVIATWIVCSCQMSVYLYHIYILFDCDLEMLFPFQLFVSFYSSSLQLAFHCLSAKYRIRKFVEAWHCICRGAHVFQSTAKIKRLEQISVLEVNDKVIEDNQKGQLVKIFDRCYSLHLKSTRMPAKLKLLNY